MAGLGFVRRLPGPLRRFIVAGVTALHRYLERRSLGEDIDSRSFKILATTPRAGGRRYTGSRVAVAGLFGLRCGLQRGAELMVLDLRAQGIDVVMVDVTAILGLVPNLPNDADPDMSKLTAFQPTDIVIHVNPPLYAMALAGLPAPLRATATIVACWVWELNVVSQIWRDCAGFVDEIWVPSPFVADALRSGLPDFSGPIRIMPYATHRAPMPKADPAERLSIRAATGVPASHFVIGTSFSFDSNYARKNPCAAINAFRAAYRRGERAILIIRCNDVGRHRRRFDHLLSYAGGDPHILIWDNADAQCPIARFYGLIDLYLSLHRSEGYGLNLVEAAQAGRDVVTADWGLAPDIAALPQVRTIASRPVIPMDTEGFYDRFPDAVWGEPSNEEAATLLAQAYDAWARQQDVPDNAP